MLSTNNICFEVRFQNTWETVIINTTQESTDKLYEMIASRNIYVKDFKEFDKTKSKFKKCSKKRFLDCINFNTALYELLTF